MNTEKQLQERSQIEGKINGSTIVLVAAYMKKV